MRPGDKSLHRLARTLALVLVLAALATVFMAYLDPHLARDLAARVWACF